MLPSRQCIRYIAARSASFGSRILQFSFALLLLGQPLAAALPSAERAALIDLYSATNGPNWTKKTNWLVTADECAWYGITCDAAHTTVQQIVLENNNLKGLVPASLGGLANLQLLAMSQNLLSGSIPSQLGALTNLRSLYLCVNALTGSIPSQLGNVTGLQDLVLCRNRLSGNIPPQLGNLTNLRDLSLFDNQLNGGIPPQLGNLANLQELWLNMNQLSGAIPAQLGSLSALQRLSLNGNQLSGSIPKALTNLTRLTSDGSDFRWNALYSTDSVLTAFLDQKQYRGDWRGTQTIAPANPNTTSATAGSITINWAPIAYAADPGFYQVHYSTTAGGPYRLFPAKTSSKSIPSLVLTALASDTKYYFVVRATTLGHSANTNAVTSAFSAEISERTSAGGPCPYSGWSDLKFPTSDIGKSLEPLGVIPETHPTLHTPMIAAELDDRVEVFKSELAIRQSVLVRLSGLRPRDYQDHLFQLKLHHDQMYALRGDTDISRLCASEIAKVNNEIAHHGLGPSVTKLPDGTTREDPSSLGVNRRSNHESGDALDVSFTPTPSNWKTIAKNAGLSAPCTEKHIHLQLVANTQCAAATTLTATASLPAEDGILSGFAVPLVPIRILLRDAAGRRVGYDATNNIEINEIGDAASYSGIDSDPQVVTIQDAPDGEYQVTAFAISSGAYTLVLSADDAEHEANIASTSITGTAIAGDQLPSLDIKVQSTAPEVPPDAPTRRRSVRH